MSAEPVEGCRGLSVCPQDFPGDAGMARHVLRRTTSSVWCALVASSPAGANGGPESENPTGNRVDWKVAVPTRSAPQRVPAAGAFATDALPVHPELLEFIEFLRQIDSNDQADEVTWLAESVCDECIQLHWRHDRYSRFHLRVSISSKSASTVSQIQFSVCLPWQYPAENQIATVTLLSGTTVPSFMQQLSDELTSFATLIGESGAPLLQLLIGHAKSVMDSCPLEMTSSDLCCCVHCNRKLKKGSVGAYPLPASIDAGGTCTCNACGKKAIHLPMVRRVNLSTNRLTGAVAAGPLRGVDDADAEVFCSICFCEDALIVEMSCGCAVCFLCFVRMCEVQVGSKTLFRVRIPAAPVPGIATSKSVGGVRPVEGPRQSIEAAKVDHPFPPGALADPLPSPSSTSPPLLAVGIPCANHLPQAVALWDAHLARRNSNRELVGEVEDAAPVPDQPNEIATEARDVRPPSPPPPSGETTVTHVAVGAAASAAPVVEPLPALGQRRGRTLAVATERSTLGRQAKEAEQPPFEVAVEPLVSWGFGLIKLLPTRVYNQFSFFAMEMALQEYQEVLICPLRGCISYPFVSEHYGTHPYCPYCMSFFCVSCSEAVANCVCDNVASIQSMDNIFTDSTLGLRNVLRFPAAHASDTISPRVEAIRVLATIGKLQQPLLLPLDGNWYSLFKRDCPRIEGGFSVSYLYCEDEAKVAVFHGVILDPSRSLREQYVYDGAVVFVIEVFTVTDRSYSVALGELTKLRHLTVAKPDLGNEGAVVRNCPLCGTPVVHFLGHGCHIINQCHRSTQEWCFACGGLAKEHSCARKCPLFCKYTVTAIKGIITVEREGCDCSICPTCKPMRPCPQCISCPACLPKTVS